MEEQIVLAKELLNSIRHAAMATVNEDGSPHNTPYFFMYNEDFTKLYWGSHPDSQHSKNITRDGKLFVVVFNSVVKGKGGLYIAASGGHALQDNEIAEGVRVHNITRSRFEQDPIPEEYYQKGSQKMWCATINKIELYCVERGADGYILRETRVSVNTEQLRATIRPNERAS